MISNSTTSRSSQQTLTTELPPSTSASTLLTTGQTAALTASSAPTLAITLGNNTYATTAPKVISPALTISSQTDPNTTITAARVTINNGFSAAQDALGVAGQTGTSGTISGLTWSYSSKTGVLSIDGSASITVYQAALRQVTYVNTSQNPSAVDRQIDFSLGNNPVNANNGHFYEFVAAPGITWTGALAATATKNYFGLQGYLATITSATEQSFIEGKVQGNGWIGASDAVDFNNPNSALSSPVAWKWVTGPEAGTVFWNGLANGSVAAGQYAHWNQRGTTAPNGDNEPNNTDGTERYAHIIGNTKIGGLTAQGLGYWNDLTNDSSNAGDFAPLGYIVEYGGLSTDPIIQISASVKVYVPALNNLRQLDFTGDGKADIFWRDQTGGDNAIWGMNGFTSTSQQVINNVPINWRVEAIADFDGNKKGDVLWRDYNTGNIAVWQMNNTAIATTAVFSGVPLDWKIVGTGDFTGDGKDDILFRNYVTGENGVWVMNGTQRVSTYSLDTVAALDWRISTVGDFDGNGKADVLWRNDTTTQNAIWLLNGNAPALNQQLIASTPAGWFAPGTGLFDAGNNRADILWRNAETGLTADWLQNGVVSTQQSALLTPIPLEWRVVGLGDFNGDGQTELLWRNYNNGSNAIWTINGATVPTTNLIQAVPPLNWEVV